MIKLEGEKERNSKGKGSKTDQEKAMCWRGNVAEAPGNKADEKPPDLTVRW